MYCMILMTDICWAGLGYSQLINILKLPFRTKNIMFRGILFLVVYFTVLVSSFALDFNGFIADEAGVLSPNTEAAMNSYLYDLQQKTKTDVAVVTLKSLNNRPIDEVALNIGREYKLGDKKLNNGAVVLVVPNDREARIEVGYGLEGAITDAHAGRILDDYMIPYFREGEYEKGIYAGTTALALDIADSYGVQIGAERPISQELDTSYIFLIILLWLLFGGFFGGRGGGTNFGGLGGGGGFGGGGASRRW